MGGRRDEKVPPTEVAEALRTGFAEAFNVQFQDASLTPDEWRYAQARVPEITL